MLLVLLRVVSVRVMRVDHVLSQVWLRPELRCGSCEVPYIQKSRRGPAGPAQWRFFFAFHQLESTARVASSRQDWCRV